MAEMLGKAVKSHDATVSMMNELAVCLQNEGVPIKR